MRRMEFAVVLVGVMALGCMPQPMADKKPATPPTPAATETATPPAAATEMVEAKVGVGKQGRSLDNESGIVVEPVKQLFRVKEKIAFDFNLTSAMNLYKADKGRAPQTHEEFMEQIVKANNINLPELPAGQRYVYDPETETLMVERPQQ